MDKETPEIKRERLRQEELKSPVSSVHGSNLADLVGSLNWKVTGILFLVIIIGGAYLLLRFNPPLQIGTVAWTENKQSIVIGIGNHGFREVEIKDVFLNNNEIPLETKIQISNPAKGFVLMDDYTSEDAGIYDFVNIEEVVIKPGVLTDDDGVSKEDKIYAISVIHHDTIHTVTIEYKHFGMTFNETLHISN